MRIRVLYLLVSPIIIGIILFAVRNAMIQDDNDIGEKLEIGSRYEIIQLIYLTGIYNSLNDQIISRDTARAYLNSKKYYKRAEVAFQSEVHPGTIMTVTGSSPKVWNLFFLPNRYFIELDPDMSRGLDVILTLDRGIEGDLNGLNPELFRRLSGRTGKLSDEKIVN